MPENKEILRLEQISKIYGSFHALSDVSFDLKSGEVHALVGENGAGKSTLMKILSGNERKDGGRILIDGKEVNIAGPNDAAAHGIAIIHQELNTIATMTVAENLALGREPARRFGILDRKKMIADAREKLAKINSTIDPKSLVGSLSIGMQQMVEIARAVSEHARILVLDEPTAALSRTETMELFKIIEQMKQQGVGLIYISHRMEEVWRLADRVSVLRDGHYVGTRVMSEVKTEDIVRMMVGRALTNIYEHEAHVIKDTVLEVRNLQTDKTGPLSFKLHAGEVVAMSGLIGSGRTEAGRGIFGADPLIGGEILLNGRPIHPRTPGEAIACGIGMLPEDRKTQALFLEHAVAWNIDVSSLARYSVHGVLRRRQLRQADLKEMEDLDLRLNAVDLPVKALSGGNQQKVALARWLLLNCQVLILDEPTRGVDIGSKRDIYVLIDKLARLNKAILVISSDLPEALGISDRVLVMAHGSIVHEFDSKDATEEKVMMYATGTKED